MLSTNALLSQLQRTTRQDESAHLHADLAAPTWPAFAPHPSDPKWVSYWVRFGA